jgi:outer membrane immunogenic protein
VELERARAAPHGEGIPQPAESYGELRVKCNCDKSQPARLGFLINPSLLLYGTGGVAYGRVEQSVPGASTKTPGVGWAAGAGVQYAFTPQWSIGAEYLHIELDGPSANVGGISIDTKATTDLGRATLNYKF